jgi:hypothetical protein
MDEATAPSASARDRHLFGPGPKRLLALDGGGVRGAVTVAFLERIEKLLRDRYGPETRLCDHFDLVGGTSTGAIIAGALALGHHVGQVKSFYLDMAKFAFKRQRWYIPLVESKFDARGLREKIEEVVGDRLLETEDLLTGFCVVTKRMDTGSPWVLSNDPRAPYWNNGKDAGGKSYIGNRYFPLVNLVRASTAAPHYFDPEILPITERAPLPKDVARPFDAPPPRRFARAILEQIGVLRHHKIDTDAFGLFVDGGVTPHNNPALALFHLVTLKAFDMQWPTGPDRLSIISIGTGMHRPRLDPENLGVAFFPKLAYQSLMSMMTDSQMLVLALMQWMGECPAPWPINSEVGSLAGEAPGGPLFRFLRYDVRLEKDWLASEIDYQVDDELLAKLQAMDEPDMVHELYEIGCRAAEMQVLPQHWGV